MSWSGWLVSGGKQFFSTTDKYGDRPASWVVGKATMPEGFDRAVCSMRQGEKSSFTMSPTFAYGVAGKAEYAVPGHAHVRVEIKLLKFEDTPLKL